MNNYSNGGFAGISSYTGDAGRSSMDLQSRDGTRDGSVEGRLLHDPSLDKQLSSITKIESSFESAYDTNDEVRKYMQIK